MYFVVWRLGKTRKGQAFSSLASYFFGAKELEFGTPQEIVTLARMALLILSSIKKYKIN